MLMVFHIPVGHLLASSPPDAIKSFGVLQEFTQRSYPVGMTSYMRMQTDIHQPAAAFTFEIQLVELFFQQL